MNKQIKKTNIKSEKGESMITLIIFILIVIMLTVLTIYFSNKAEEVGVTSQKAKTSLNIPAYFSKEFEFDEQYNTEEKVDIVTSVTDEEGIVRINFSNGDVIRYEEKKLYLNNQVIVDELYEFTASKNVTDNYEFLNITYREKETDKTSSTSFSYDHTQLEEEVVEEDNVLD